MNQLFDPFGRAEKPYMVLCNPNGEELYALTDAFEVNHALRFNALSEVSFSFPKSVDNGTTSLDAYDLLKSKRLILLENSGYYIISNVEEDLDGKVPIKNVDCVSIDGELINKKLMVFSYTSIRFYDIIDPTDTLLDKIMQYIPSWTIGNVDVELTAKYRSFDISDSTIYSFLIEDVEEAFECVFFFDYENKVIDVKTIDNATTETDIFLSFDNLIENATFEEKSDELTTVLYVYGGDGLDIRGVNPLGTTIIYDFTYYKTSDWMSSDLIVALTAWEDLVDLRQPDYASNLAILRTAYDDKYGYETTKIEKDAELAAQETLLATAIQTKQPTTTILAAIAILESEISVLQSQIDGQQSIIDAQLVYLDGITDELSFANNFTDAEYAELSRYFYENTYQNENIIKLDSMTPAELQDQAKDLYDQAVGVLAKLSEPRYEFSLDSANFLALEEYSQFIDELELGCIVNAELEDDVVIEAVLLELELDYDDPTSFSMTFGNRLRLDGDKFVYSDLMGAVNKTGSDVSFNSETWSNWDRYHKDDVSTFIVSALDASVNKLITGSDQSFQIDQTGLRGRQFSGGSYDDKQLWVRNNVLAFTDDGWSTAALAIGEVDLPSGGTSYGVVGGSIFGTILAGNSLAITSEDTSFTLDQNGAVLSNASFTVTSGDATITLDPSSGLKINNAGTDTFYLDVDGNIVMEGDITAASGNIAGFDITSTSIYKNSTHYLDSTGSIKWGSAEITSSGEIKGATLDWASLTNVPANQISYGGSSGYFSGGGVYGGTMRSVKLSNDVGSGTIEITGTGALQILATGLEMTNAGSSYMGYGSSLAYMTNNGNTLKVQSTGAYWNTSLLATQSWVGSNYSSIGHTHSQYYESGDSPSFYNVTASNDYNIGIYSGLGNASSPSILTWYDRDSNYHYIYVRGGLITAMG